MSDAGITVVIGKPGAGKSYFAVRAIVMALLRGEPVVTNVPLREGWADEVAKMRGGRYRGRRWRAARAEHLRWLVHVIDHANELARIGVPGCGKCEHCRAGRECTKEGRAVAVVDEAPKFLDPRTWNLAKDGAEGGRPVLERKKTVDGLRMHRKRGFAVYLITQAEGLIDNQIRGLGERYVTLRNLRRIPHWANPFWYLRLDLFCAVTLWGAPGKVGTLRARTEWYLLNRRIAGLYDTMGGFASDGSEDPDVWPWGGARTSLLDAIPVVAAEPQPAEGPAVDGASSASDSAVAVVVSAADGGVREAEQ